MHVEGLWVSSNIMMAKLARMGLLLQDFQIWDRITK